MNKIVEIPKFALHTSSCRHLSRLSLFVMNYTVSGFYFYARGKVEDVYRELRYQLSQYESAFYNDNLLIKFKTIDSWEQHIIDLLNERRYEYEPAPDEDHLI